MNTTRRWTSRKFITTLIAQLAAVAVLLWPEHRSAITEAAQAVAALAVIGLTALGYTAAEASVDRRSAGEPAGEDRSGSGSPGRP